ncbi:MAG: hypothetical protein HY752_00890 [Nitrospirae bacterium]|nr:hypothetical protein [Nitrospirota bacterium]
MMSLRGSDSDVAISKEILRYAQNDTLCQIAEFIPSGKIEIASAEVSASQ